MTLSQLIFFEVIVGGGMNPKNFEISYGFDDTIKTTQLGYDAYHGRIKEIKAAIDLKIDWSKEGVEGLHGAIFGGQEECFECLLAAGSPVNKNTHYLLCRVLPNLYEKYFLDPKYSISLNKDIATKNLVDSCCYGSIKLCQHFLNFGADPNDNSYGVLPIITAARKFRKDLMEVLLDNGAQINNIGVSQHSALRVMVSSGSHLDKSLRKELYEYMISRGAIAIPPFNDNEKKAAQQGDIVSLL